MSMEICTALHGVSRSPLGEERESLKRQKTEPDTVVLHGVTQPDSDLDWVTKPIEEFMRDRHIYCSSFEEKNEAQERRKQARKDAVAEYLKNSRDLSPYDAIPIPHLALEVQSGRNWPRPLYICDSNRSSLVDLCKAALAYYHDKNQGAQQYVFVEIVKAAWRKTPLGSNFITFKAREDTKDVDPSNYPAKVFQAYVIHVGHSIKVEDCSIKLGN